MTHTVSGLPQDRTARMLAKFCAHTSDLEEKAENIIETSEAIRVFFVSKSRTHPTCDGWVEPWVERGTLLRRWRASIVALTITIRLLIAAPEFQRNERGRLGQTEPRSEPA